MNQREDLMVSLGIQRYDGIVESAKERGALSSAPHGMTLLTRITSQVEEGVKAWVKKASRKQGPGHHSLRLLRMVKPGQVALIACRVVVDRLAEGVHTEQKMATTIGLYVEHEAYLAAFRKQARPLWRQLQKQQRRASVAHKRKVFVAAAARTGVEFERWTAQDRAVVGLVMLDIIQRKVGLLTRTVRKRRKGKRTVTDVFLNPTAELELWLNTAQEQHALRLPVLLPTEDPPLDWTNNWDGGYHGLNLQDGGLMRPRPGCKFILDDLNETSCPMVFAGVNALQSTAWILNEKVRAVVSLLWADGARVAGLPGDEKEELPSRPDNINEEEEVLKKWKKAAALVHARNAELYGHRLLVRRTLDIAEVVQDRPFFFPQKLDFRGRVYPMPAFLQPQGADVAKGMLQFSKSDRVELNSEGARWLSVHAANTYGDDKLPLSARSAWAMRRQKEIIAAAKYPLAQTWWQEADKPFQFLAVCFELAEMFEKGAVESRIPVAIDGSNNGLQIFSLMLRDPVGGAATNCLSSPTPMDIYQDVADRATARLKSMKEPWAKAWSKFLVNGLPRKAVKRSVMTRPYGAKSITNRDYIRDWYRSLPMKAEQALEVSVYEMADVVWECIAEAVPKAADAMDWLREVAGLATDKNVPMVWYTPHAHIPVGQCYRNISTQKIETVLDGGVRRTLSLAKDGHKMDRTKMKDAISPNLVHSLDATALFMTLDKMLAKGVRDFLMVHDSYATHATKTALMFEAVREAYAELFAGDFLGDWRQEMLLQLRGAQIPLPPEQGKLEPTALLQSPHFFH